MLGFHPFSTQTFSSAIPFLDVQTTTNLVSAAMGSVLPVVTAVTVGTNLAMTAAQGSVTGNQLLLLAQPSGTLKGRIKITEQVGNGYQQRCTLYMGSS